MTVEIRYTPQIPDSVATRLEMLFQEQGVPTSRVKYHPAAQAAVEQFLPEAITLIVSLSLAETIKGFFKKPGEELYAAFKKKLLELIEDSRAHEVVWRRERSEPSVKFPASPNTIKQDGRYFEEAGVSPPLAWEFHFTGGVSFRSKFVFSYDLAPVDCAVAHDKIRETLLIIRNFVQWEMDQLKCKMDDPKWVLGASFPGDGRVFVGPTQYKIGEVAGGTWLFNVKRSMWVRCP